MSEPHLTPLLRHNPIELERILRGKQPAICLISERHLGRILDRLIEQGVRVSSNPQLPVWVNREQLPSEFTLDSALSRVLLLTPPDDRLLYDFSDNAILTSYVRLLCRAEIRARIDADSIVAQVVVDCFLKLPKLVREDVRFVLEAESQLPNRATDIELSHAFAPLWLDALVYAPHALADWFPLASQHRETLCELSILFDTNALLSKYPVAVGTPLVGAPTAFQQRIKKPDSKDTAHIAKLGNRVRAAVMYMRLATAGPDKNRTWYVAAARRELRDGLIPKLDRVFGWKKKRADRWTQALFALLALTQDGRWPYATRALYDLQKLAADLGQPLYRVAAIDWLLSFGRRPLKQPLDRARDVILLRRLMRAESHVQRAALAANEREELLALFHEEMHEAETRIGASLGPVIRRVAEDVGFQTANITGRVALQKLVAELIDRLCERGFLRMSDLRDAIARNALKLADVRGPIELFQGDTLLKMDARLSDELPGIYHKGEVYLRAIQRVSAVSFGTKAGRFLTRFVTIPFGGAFLGLEFLQHVVHGVQGIIRIIAKTPHGHHAHLHFVTLPSVFIVGMLVVLIAHTRIGRSIAMAVVSRMRNVLATIFITVPLAIWSSPPVQFLSNNRISRAFSRWLMVPFVVSAIVLFALIHWDFSLDDALEFCAVLFVLATAVWASPYGQRQADHFGEVTADSWRNFWWNLLPGTFTWIVWAFRELMGLFERGLYAVDEWFRYREGQSRESLIFKVIFGLIWFPIAYLFRFAFYLLIEPQVNPVKHFPVVTVSHKVIWPMVPQLSAWTGISPWTVGMFVNGVPGIFGFMAWELMANWKLYRANQSQQLEPQTIGHHGETMRGLFRVGFHSGTVPKLFRKLRKYHEAATPEPRFIDREHRALEHLERAIADTISREILPLWDENPELRECRIAVASVTLGCQSATIVLSAATGEPPLQILIAMHDEQIVGSVAEYGWAKSLSTTAMHSLKIGIHGAFAYAAVAKPDALTRAEWVSFWSKSL